MCCEGGVLVGVSVSLSFTTSVSHLLAFPFIHIPSLVAPRSSPAAHYFAARERFSDLIFSQIVLCRNRRRLARQLA